MMALAPKNEIMHFHDRRLVFVDGPGVVVELAQWVTEPSGIAGAKLSPCKNGAQ